MHPQRFHIARLLIRGSCSHAEVVPQCHGPPHERRHLSFTFLLWLLVIYIPHQCMNAYRSHHQALRLGMILILSRFFTSESPISPNCFLLFCISIIIYPHDSQDARVSVEDLIWLVSWFIYLHPSLIASSVSWILTLSIPYDDLRDLCQYFFSVRPKTITFVFEYGKPHRRA